MFEYSDKSQKLQVMLKTFMDDYVYPTEAAYTFQSRTANNRDAQLPLISVLKQRAKAAGLWNIFISEQHTEYSELGGLSCLDCAPLAEMMGRVDWSPEIFNCDTRDTANMEILMKCATREQKEKWLIPLLNGDIHASCSAAKPGVMISEKAYPLLSIDKHADEYVLSGSAWFASETVRENTKLFIVSCNSNADPSNLNIKQTHILVPVETVGVEIVRSLSNSESDDIPSNHLKVYFGDVRLPVKNILREENQKCNASQDSLGRTDVHRCMQLIGSAQRSLELVCKGANPCSISESEIIADNTVSEDIAKSFSEIEMARLLVLKTCKKIDLDGANASTDMIAASKTSVPTIVQHIIERCFRIQGAGGSEQDIARTKVSNYGRKSYNQNQENMMTTGEHLIEEYTY